MRNGLRGPVRGSPGMRALVCLQGREHSQATRVLGCPGWIGPGACPYQQLEEGCGLRASCTQGAATGEPGAASCWAGCGSECSSGRDPPCPCKCVCAAVEFPSLSAREGSKRRTLTLAYRCLCPVEICVAAHQSQYPPPQKDKGRASNGKLAVADKDMGITQQFQPWASHSEQEVGES